MIRAMIDCETLGVSTHPVILQIGVAVLDSNLDVVRARHIDVDPVGQAGAMVDISTVLWWLEQSDAARASITAPEQGPVQLHVALEALNFIMTANRVEEVWANGTAEDLVWLKSAFDACGIKPAWDFRQQRCYRTLRALKPDVPLPAPIEPAHKAVNDAVWQAKHLAELLR